MTKLVWQLHCFSASLHFFGGSVCMEVVRGGHWQKPWPRGAPQNGGEKMKIKNQKWHIRLESESARFEGTGNACTRFETTLICLVVMGHENSRIICSFFGFLHLHYPPVSGTRPFKSVRDVGIIGMLHPNRWQPATSSRFFSSAPACGSTTN